MAQITNQLVIVGNLTADPELRFTPNGVAVANFTVASTPRQFDKNTNEWKDGNTLFQRCSVWREVAENVAETLHKGDKVVVVGRLSQDEYEKDGQKRVSFQLDVDEVGVSLGHATAVVTRKTSNGGSQSVQQHVPQGQGSQQHAPQGQQQGAPAYAGGSDF